MSKAQNKSMKRKRRQGIITPQKTNNNIIEDLVKSEGDESTVADLGRTMIEMFNGLKKKMQKQLNKYQENMDKKLDRTQKHQNELRGISTSSK
jgi:molybdenum-dependent DNA-binding transcriptional regulator ModE